MDTTIRKGSRTRQQIIERATVLFARNGFKPTSLRQILDATGLAKGGFYFHFKSKEDLGIAVLDSLENCWTDQILPQISCKKNAGEKLEVIFSSTGDCCQKADRMRPIILLLNLATEMAEVNPTFSARLQRILEGWRLVIEAVIEEGKLQRLFKSRVDAEAVAGIILSNILGANLFGILSGRTDSYYAQLDTFRHIVLQAISTKANNQTEV